MRARRWLFVILLSATVLYIAYLIWLQSQHLLIYRTRALTTSIHLVPEALVDRQFSVAMKAKYLVGVGYNRPFRLSPAAPVPTDFAATGKIALDGAIVSQGFPAWSRPALLSGDYLLLCLYSFDGLPGKTYELSLRIDDVSPNFANAAAEVIVQLDPHYDMGYLTRMTFLKCVAAVLAVLWLVHVGTGVQMRKGNPNAERGSHLKSVLPESNWS